MDDITVRQTLGFPVIEGFISALMNLYHFQVSSGLNPNPNPRAIAVRNIWKGRRWKEHERKRKEYIDRGTGTLSGGYKEDDIRQFVRVCWTAYANGEVSSQTVGSYFRTSCVFLLAHNMLLRGENRRHLQLADLSSLELKNEGTIPCMATVLLMDDRETKLFGRLKYGTVVRHRNPLMCASPQKAP